MNNFNDVSHPGTLNLTRSNLFIAIIVPLIVLTVIPWSRYLKQPMAKQGHESIRFLRLWLYRFLTYQIPFLGWKATEALFLIGYLSILVPLTVIPLVLVPMTRLSLNETNLYGFLSVAHMSVASILPLRRTILNLMFGVSFNQLLFWHRWLATGTVVMGLVHGGLKLYQISLFGPIFSHVNPDNPENLYGFISGLLFALLFVFSMPISFQVGSYSEVPCIQGSIPTLMVTLVLHVQKAFPYVISVVVFYGLDRLIRFVMLAQPAQITRVQELKDLVKVDVTLQNWFGFLTRPRPGQFYFLYAPGTSITNSHPFSLVVAPPTGSDLDLEKTSSKTALSFGIRKSGQFTHNLSHLTVSSLIRLEGPYGRSFDGVLNAPVVVLIGGGIGIGPLLSLLDTLLHPSQSPSHVEVIWTVHHASHLDWYSKELNEACKFKNVKVRLFVTGESELDLSDKVDVGLGLKKSHETLTEKSLEADQGRPDFDRLLGHVKRSWPTLNASVAICGPKSLVRTASKACFDVSDTLSLYSVYTEEFEL